MASSNNLYYFLLYSLYYITFYVNRKSNNIVLSFIYNLFGLDLKLSMYPYTWYTIIIVSIIISFNKNTGVNLNLIIYI